MITMQCTPALVYQKHFKQKKQFMNLLRHLNHCFENTKEVGQRPANLKKKHTRKYEENYLNIEFTETNDSRLLCVFEEMC